MKKRKAGRVRAAGTSAARPEGVVFPGAGARNVLVVVLLLALATRLYVLLLTRDQPVWWDEAEYLLKARSIALGTPDTGYFTGRPVVMSLWLSGAFALGGGEGAVRIALALASTATVLLTYDIGRRLYGVRDAAVAALLMTVFYVPVFYSARIMTEIPHLLFCLLGIDLYLSKTRRALWLVGPALAVAALLRFPAALMLVVVGVDAAITGRLRDKALWISAALGVVVGAPYLLWSARRYGDPLHAWRVSAFIMPRLDFGARMGGLGRYLAWLSSSLGWLLTILLVLGAARSLVRSRGDRGPLSAATDCGSRPSQSWLWLWMLLPLFYFGWSVRPVLDRYVILALPPVFLMIARGASWLSALAPPRLHKAASVVARALVVVGALLLARDADRIVRDKLASQVELREAGQWVKDHTSFDTALVSTSPAQLTYYAQRPTFAVGDDAETFARLRREHAPRYLILSRYQDVPAWLGAADLNSLGARIVGKFSQARPNATVLELSAP